MGDGMEADDADCPPEDYHGVVEVGVAININANTDIVISSGSRVRADRNERRKRRERHAKRRRAKDERIREKRCGWIGTDEQLWAKTKPQGHCSPSLNT